MSSLLPAARSRAAPLLSCLNRVNTAAPLQFYQTIRTSSRSGPSEGRTQWSPASARPRREGDRETSNRRYDSADRPRRDDRESGSSTRWGNDDRRSDRRDDRRENSDRRSDRRDDRRDPREERRPALREDRPPSDKPRRRLNSELEAINRGLPASAVESSSTSSYTPRSTAGPSTRYTPPPRFRETGYSAFEAEKPWATKTRREIRRTVEDSEFIYGSSVVEAAIKSGRRTFYKLYIYSGENRTPEVKERDAWIKKLGSRAHINIIETMDGGLLDSMSNSRPHNGYVLECSPLPKTPILSLQGVPAVGGSIALQIAQHDPSQPELILNSLDRTIPSAEADRYPLLLMLDGVLDPGNLGAILRSAYYLGCSGVILSGTNSAPLSPVALKSSAGAAEFLPIMSFRNPVRFIESSREHGWRFYAAVPPRDKKTKGADNSYVRIEDFEVKEALKTAPTVIVVGAEGEGLRSIVERACQRKVTIETSVRREVDSLNASVAAALLVHGFTARHEGRGGKGEDDGKLF